MMFLGSDLCEVWEGMKIKSMPGQLSAVFDGLYSCAARPHSRSAAPSHTGLQHHPHWDTSARQEGEARKRFSDASKNSHKKQTCI